MAIYCIIFKQANMLRYRPFPTLIAVLYAISRKIIVRETRKGQSRMDNPETLVILGAQNTTKNKRKKTNTIIQNTSTQKTKKMSNTDELVCS